MCYASFNSSSSAIRILADKKKGLSNLIEIWKFNLPKEKKKKKDLESLPSIIFKPLRGFQSLFHWFDAFVKVWKWPMDGIIKFVMLN